MSKTDTSFELRQTIQQIIDKYASVGTAADRIAYYIEHEMPRAALATPQDDGLREQTVKNKLVAAILSYPPETMTEAERKADDMMTSRFMKDLPYTPHGFRSTFRDWMAHINVPFEVAETAIAHRVGNKITRAYLRDDYWEQRKVIMHQWANHLLGQGSAKVLPLTTPSNEH